MPGGTGSTGRTGRTGRTGGRYARGERRRRVLVETAAELLLEQGLSALSHRAVAARAGLPLASTTYYFDSADDLRDEALQHVAETWATRADGVVTALPARLDRAGAARAVVNVVGADAPSAQLLLMYERYLEAGRHERLRPVVARWNSHVQELVRQVLLRADLPASGEEPRLVLAVADGIAARALAEGGPLDVAVGDAVTAVLSLLPGSAPARS